MTFNQIQDYSSSNFIQTLQGKIHTYLEDSHLWSLGVIFNRNSNHQEDHSKESTLTLSWLVKPTPPNVPPLRNKGLKSL